MPALPARLRPRLVGRPRRMLREAWGLAPGWVWRLRHLAERGPFQALDARGVRVLRYVASDGAVGEVLAVPPGAGAPGEPVVLLATLGLSPRAFLAGAGPRLVDRLVEAGFAPYLVGHRACGDGPGQALEREDFDAVVDLDLPAALDLVCSDAGFPRAHVLGHGLGGQLWLGHAAVHGTARWASGVVVQAPVRFDATAAPWLGRLARRLPPGWRLPVAEVARWAAAIERPPAGRAGPARRGLLSGSGADVPAALAAQLASWLDAGALVDRGGARDYAAGLADRPEPLLVVVGEGDVLCPAPAALAVREHWRAGPVTLLRLPDGFDHLDPLVHADADASVSGPVVAWLTRHRLRAWVGAPVVEVGLRPGT